VAAKREISWAVCPCPVCKRLAFGAWERVRHVDIVTRAGYQDEPRLIQVECPWCHGLTRYLLSGETRTTFIEITTEEAGEKTEEGQKPEEQKEGGEADA